MLLPFVVVATSVAAPPRAALGTVASLTRTRVEPGAPVELYLAMENRTDKVLTFETHALPGCYLDKFVNVRLEPEVERKPLPDCSKPPIRKVAPREKVAMLADLREVFQLPDEGSWTVFVEWKDGGPDIYSPLTAIPGTVRTASAVYKGRVSKEGMVPLPDRSTLVFTGHTSVPSGRRGEPPQLRIDTVHRVPGAGETPRQVVIDPVTTREFDFGAYKVALQAHQFDQWMELTVFPAR